MTTQQSTGRAEETLQDGQFPSQGSGTQAYRESLSLKVQSMEEYLNEHDRELTYTHSRDRSSADEEVKTGHHASIVIGRKVRTSINDRNLSVVNGVLA